MLVHRPKFGLFLTAAICSIQVLGKGFVDLITDRHAFIRSWFRLDKLSANTIAGSIEGMIFPHSAAPRAPLLAIHGQRFLFIAAARARRQLRRVESCRRYPGHRGTPAPNLGAPCRA